jgi:hypothetical protein
LYYRYFETGLRESQILHGFRFKIEVWLNFYKFPVWCPKA